MATYILGVHDVAQYFLANVDEEAGDNHDKSEASKTSVLCIGFSRPRLQSGEPLFPDSILAWSHGPVIRRVYNEYKHLKWHPIACPASYRGNELPPEVREILDTVNLTYGQFTATKLEAMTHEEPPWQRTPRNGIISLDSLNGFFSTLVEAGRYDKAITGEPLWPTNSLQYQRREISTKMSVRKDKLRAVARNRQVEVDW